MPLHLSTPLLESRALSLRSQKNILLKMEALQPTGSFKARGIGHACELHQRQGATRFISSSGGNAGLAVAYAGRKLGVAVTVFVPQTTSARAKALIADEGAEVIVHGASWSEANEAALAAVTAGCAFIHPFDDPLLWQGHATLVDELVQQLPQAPDLLVCAVGGGGLLCGVVEGLQRNGWGAVPVLAAETRGADSYAAALRAGHPVALPRIDSIATSLGAREVCAQSVQLAQGHRIESVVVPDAQAVAACADFRETQRLLVEPACGAALAALNSGAAVLAQAKTVVVVVCGGVGVTSAQLDQWTRDGTGASA